MLKQLLQHSEDNHLLLDFQSAHWVNYSTETSLVKLVNDILWSMEQRQIMMVVLLDLSMAFDTVDHDILLSILNKQFGICGKALEWFNSYLQPRYFKVKIGKVYSQPQQLHFSVPQGSCSGANVFTCNCLLIDQIVPKDLTLNGFTNDHSLRKSFPAGNRTQEQQAKLRMEHTFSNIKEWMDSMCLKLNSEKTEYIMFGSCQQLAKINPEPLHAGPDPIELSNKVKYIGSLLDNTLSFDLHVSSKVQKAMVNFIKIKSICKYITWEACTTLLLMLCRSHLDYLNAVLYGIPNKTLNRYQMIQKMCAKLALGKSKYDSSIESLKTLHWLPIHQQIEFKILVLTHKCINNLHQDTRRNLFQSGNKKGKT